MQHVLRCWERQSDGSGNPSAAGAPPRALLRELTALAQPPPQLMVGAGCSLPKNAISPLCPSGLASPTPTPKLVPTPLRVGVGALIDTNLWST